jgi:hypothetical protein
MKNLWVQTENPFVTWHADVTPLLGKPESLVELVCAICDVGAEQEVFVPVEVPRLGFARGRTASISALVRQRWTDHGIVELFQSLRGARAEARPAWFDRDDRIIEGNIDDLGLLLTTLQPVPGAIYPNYRAPGFAPVAFSGWSLAYPDRRALAETPRDRVTFGCSLHSDIWFPFVLGFAHPQCDLEHWFDNRELETRHTPRLNAFIERCATLVTEAGARWYVEPAESNRLVAAWVNERGIRLDGPVPDLMPETALEAIWEAVDLD